MEEEYKNAGVPMPTKAGDLKQIIQTLETRNEYLHKHVEKLTNELLTIRQDNKRLAKQCEDQINQFRNKGII